MGSGGSFVTSSSVCMDDAGDDSWDRNDGSKSVSCDVCESCRGELSAVSM